MLINIVRSTAQYKLAFLISIFKAHLNLFNVNLTHTSVEVYIQSMCLPTPEGPFTVIRIQVLKQPYQSVWQIWQHLSKLVKKRVWLVLAQHFSVPPLRFVLCIFTPFFCRYLSI